MTAYVEIVLTENGSIQHPMLGIFSNSIYSQYVWLCIDHIFQNRIVPYLEGKYDYIINANEEDKRYTGSTSNCERTK